MIDPRFTDLTAHLWRGGKYSYFWSPNIEGEKYSYWLTASKHDEVPKLFLDKDAYFGIHPSNIRRSEHERAKITDIAAINCLYCEFDCPTPEAKADKLNEIKLWAKQPACIIDSGGGLHVYVWLCDAFLLDTPEKRQRAIDLQYAFVEMVKSDDGAKDLARVLRIPGTFNHKPKFGANKPLVAIVLWQPTQTHELREIEAVLQPYIDARTKAAIYEAHTPSSHAVSLSDKELLDVLFHSKNGTQYRELFLGNLLSAGNDHSKADQIFCNGLAWLTGRDIGRMDSLFRQSGLYREKWEVKSYRERTLNNAAKSAQTIYEPKYVDQDAIKAAEASVSLNGKGSHAIANAVVATSGAWKAPNNPTTADYIKSLNSLGYYFRLNDLDDLVEVNHQPLNDVIAAKIRSQMRDLGYTGRHIGAMEDAYLAHAGDNRYHPIRDYLQGLWWDGDDHIRLLSKHFKDKHTLIIYDDGATETVFHAWLRRWLVGAVAKVCEAGMLKAQNAVLVIEGSQNLGKSTFANWLCSGTPKHFIEQSVDPENKEHIRNLAGKWIWEIGEMGSTTRKADRESLKHFLSQTTVTFRTPYAKHAVTKPALASFIGTVNNEGGFLQDSTGTRRFMTVGLTHLDHAYVTDLDVDQLWAQAYQLYLNGESWRLCAEEVAKRDELNGTYKVEDAYEGWVKRFYDVDLERSEQQTPGWFTTTQEIVSELKNRGVTGDTRAITMYLAATMKELGLEKVRYPLRNGPRGYWGVRIKPE